MRSTRTATVSTRSLASLTATWIPSVARRPQHPLTVIALDAGESAVDTDCDDADNTIYPGATEVPDDAIDQDCDGFDTVTCFVDGDLDTFGGTTTTTSADGDCLDSGESTVDTDCNDADNTVYPGATEVPDDAIDQDCDGFDTVTCFVDGDLDTFGGTTTTTSADGDCVDSGESTVDTDCNDADNTIYPGATEVPDDAIDQDCDGFDTVTCFVDGDLDTFGGTTTTTSADGDCLDSGESTVDTDCNDADNTIYPGATEVPDDAIDQDCDGLDTVTCFVDGDLDTFGSTTTTTSADGDCLDSGESTVDTDCNDADNTIYPGATEVPDDAIDQDCDGFDTVTCFVDGDLDTFGSTTTTTSADGDCLDSGESAVDTDCNDADNTIYPGATEVPDDAIDQDCDGFDTVTCFVDGDLDTFGGTTTTTSADGDCADAGESTVDTDCDDTDNTIYPGATEVPDDAIDQDCDGFDTVTCFVDGDLDTFGGTTTTTSADGDCLDSGESAIDTDCNDADNTDLSRRD